MRYKSSPRYFLLERRGAGYFLPVAEQSGIVLTDVESYWNAKLVAGEKIQRITFLSKKYDAISEATDECFADQTDLCLVLRKFRPFPCSKVG